MSLEKLTDDQLVKSLRSTSDQLIELTKILSPLVAEYDKLKVEFNETQNELTHRREAKDD